MERFIGLLLTNYVTFGLAIPQRLTFEMKLGINIFIIEISVLLCIQFIYFTVSHSLWIPIGSSFTLIAIIILSSQISLAQI